MYDTLVWNDGPEFIMHHLLSGIVAYFVVHPFYKLCHVYCVFFMGISEISTSVLSLLANFDEVHGLAGLADAFPMTKIVLAASFAVLFVICRIVLWPFCGYQFVKDARMSLKSKSAQSVSRRGPLIYFLFVIVVLTGLQFFWLGQIVQLNEGTGLTGKITE